MRIWKRVLSAVLVLTLAFSMVSCGGEAPAGDDTAGENIAAGSENTPVDMQESGTAEDNSDKNAVQEGTFVEEDGTVRQVTIHKSADGLVTYNIDAEVTGKDTADIPIIEVAPYIFSSEDLKTITSYVAGDVVLYDDVAEAEVYFRQGVFPEGNPVDYNYHDYDYYSPGFSDIFDDGEYPFADHLEFSAYCMTEDGVPMGFSSQISDGINNFMFGGLQIYVEASDYEYPETPLDENRVETAIKAAQDFLEEIGLADYEMIECTDDNGVVMTFVPSYYGTEMLNAAENTGASTWSFDVDQGWQYHELRITYKYGRLFGMFMRSPIDVLSELPQTLLSYDDAIAAVCRELENKFSSEQLLRYYKLHFPDFVENAFSWNMFIDKLDLVYIRVPSADNPENYYLIPSWVVYGTHSMDTFVRDNVEVSINNKSISYGNENEPLMIISAVDGKQLDFVNGY